MEIDKDGIRHDETYLFITEIIAKDPIDGIIKKWGGPNIPANTFEEAESFAQKYGLGYCKIVGQLMEEIEISDKEFENIVRGIANKN
jgi:hypothetical protein